MFLISTIIPIYNSKNTINATLNSALKQTYKEPFEIIVINDGSYDGCEKIVEEIIANNQTNRVIKLLSQQNGGVSSARNVGIREARGEYVAFLDSDDIWHPQKLDIVAKILQEKQMNFLGHGFTLKNNFEKIYKLEKTKKISFMMLLLKNFAVTPSVVIRRSECDFFNESMSYTEDHELWLRIALKQSVYYLDAPLVAIGRPQLSEGGLSANKWAMRKGELQMYLNIAKKRKILFLFLPLLLSFSLLKHFRHFIKDLCCKK